MEQWAGRADHQTSALWADRSQVWIAVHEAAHVVAEGLSPSRLVGHRPLFGEVEAVIAGDILGEEVAQAFRLVLAASMGGVVAARVGRLSQRALGG